MKNLRYGIALFLSTVCCSVNADTILFSGCELTTPDTGYAVKTEKKMVSLVNGKKKLVVEVYRFSKVPKSDKPAILEILKPRKNTTDVVVLDAKDVEQHGVTGLNANGTAKIRGGPVLFKIRSIPAGDHAVIAVAFMREGDPKSYEKELGEILDSLKPRKDET